MQNDSFVFRAFDFITKYSIYALIFLIPLFFLPWTTDVLDFNKQALLVLLIFIALFSWMLKVLISGKFEVNFGRIDFVVGALFLIYLLATLFSVNMYGSFWGWPQLTSDSLLSLAGLIALYFLISNVFSRQNIFTGLVILFISSLIAEIIGALQLSGVFLPFGFAQSVFFNTVGTVGYLGFFVAILLPLTIAMLIISKKWLRILFAAQLILSIFILFLVNYAIVWWAVLIGSAILMIFGMVKRSIFDARWIALPMFFLAVSLFFILLNPNIPWIAPRVHEVFLSQGNSLNISLQAIKARPIFGSGPGTFSYDFLKFKDAGFSKSPLWSMTFSQASSKILGDLASTGVLGLVALLLFLSAPIFYGAKFLISEKIFIYDEKQKESSLLNPKSHRILMLGVSAALATQVVAYFLYNSNIVLGFLNFFMLATLVVLIASDKKEYMLRPSSVMTLVMTFAFTLVFIFGLGLLIIDGQKYVAEIDYHSGLDLWRVGSKDAGTKSLELAASLNPSSDLYLRQLSQVYILSLKDELRGININQAPSAAEKSKVQALITNSVNAAKRATDLNPNSASDWANRGNVYQTLIGLVGDAVTWANNSYDRSLRLNPNDPYVLSQGAAVDFTSASNLGKDQASSKTQLLNTARDKLETATALNPNYSNGLYYLGLVYDALGQKGKAIEVLTRVQKLNPSDATVSKILSNLNAGQPALQNLSGTIPPAGNSTGTNQ